MCLYDSVIGEKSVTHGTTPPFPLSAASKQAEYAARLCCVSSRFVPRFLSASSAGSNTKRFPPASVPAGTDAGGNLFVLLPALDAERNRGTKRLDTQHNRAAYSACFEAAESGNGGVVP